MTQLDPADHRSSFPVFRGGGTPSRAGRGHWPRPAAIHLALTLAGLLLAWITPSATGATYHWSSSSYRIYVTGPGAVRLTDVQAALPKVPLEQVAPGIWHLRANLFMEQGAKLLLHGTRIGGDVNELRLMSNNDSHSNNFVSITADFGTIDIRSTRVTSWDDAVGGPDTEHYKYGRAYLRVRSTIGDDNVTKYESRMDIIDSDVGNLGSYNNESYGLTWKVYTPKSGGNFGDITNLYSLVDVYGDIRNSRIHHNFFGVYTYGAYGMHMANNEVDHNVWYGLDPHDDSDFLVIENNNVHHNGTHGIIASQRCNNLIIRNNVSWKNLACGIMLHRSSDHSLIEGNRCLDNGDAGIAIFDNRHTTIRKNICRNNFKAGIRFSVGSAENLVEDNEFSGSDNFGLYFYKGGDAPLPGDDGRPKKNRFFNNLISNNRSSPIYLGNSDDNVFAGNLFLANAGPIVFLNGRRNVLDSNSIPAGVITRLQGSSSAPATATVRNQDNLSVQVDIFSSVTFQDNAGRVFDPQQGGLPNTVNPSGTLISLTGAEIDRASVVYRRNLTVVPDAGTALVAISIWNLSGDLAKRWITQAGSSTRQINYRVGDLAPGTSYTVLKGGDSSRFTSDNAGFINFQDRSVATGPVEFVVVRTN